MNISQIRSFVAVVDHGSFSAAARALKLSQPAVTMQVQGLEGDVGATLLERRYRRVDLTEAGRTLLPFARRVLAEIETAHSEIERLGETVSGHLDLAVSTTPGQYVLPRLLGEFLRRYPQVTVSLRIYDTTDVVARVESGEAHLGLTGARVPGAKVVYEECGSDELIVIAPPGHPLAGRRSVPLDELAREPFIEREAGSGTRMVLEETLRLAGIDASGLRIVMELGTSEAIVNAVEGGVGVGVVSHWMADKALRLGTVARLDVERFPVTRPFFAVLPRGEMSRAAAALLDYLRDADF